MTVALLAIPALGAHADVLEQQPITRIPIEESQNLHFHRLSTADGLSQARVGQIIQDGLGFIWFGTQ